MKKINIKLASKILLISTIILFIAIGVNTSISSIIFQREYSSALIEKGYLVAETLKNQLDRLLHLGIDLNNLIGFDEQCMELVLEYNISYAMVLNKNNKIFFHNNPNKHGKIINDIHNSNEKSFCVLKQDSKTFYDINIPIINEYKQHIANIRIGFPTSNVSIKTKSLITSSIWISVLSFILASILLYIFISNWVTSPIRRLINTISKIRTENDLKAQIKIESNDEVGELGSAFNKLISDLNKVQNKIKKYNIKLKEKVNERTIELKEINKKLKVDIIYRKKIESELHEYSKELTRSNKELEQFAYIASHDLQEPLRMVTSYLHLLKRRYHDLLDPEADEFIDFAVDGAIRMQQLINDLLLYSRVNKQRVHLVDIEMETIFSKVMLNLKIAINESKAKITHDKLPIIKSDQRQMIQLLQNLIANSIKFKSEKPPKIHIGVHKKEGNWLFHIKDNGIGIDMKQNERIFEIFHRLHREDHLKGTGIGLAICKKITTQLGGRIWLDSKPGKGSTFYFTIPATSNIVVEK